MDQEIAWLGWTGLHLTPWKLIGLTGATMFGARWLVQAFASHRAGQPVIPRLFWYMSLCGSLMALSYFLFSSKQDAVGTLQNLLPALTAAYSLYLDIRNGRQRHVPVAPPRSDRPNVELPFEASVRWRRPTWQVPGEKTKRLEALGTSASRALRDGFRHAIATVGGMVSRQLVKGSPLDPGAVRSILVCRPNAKLGNTLLLTPLLIELRRLYPHADIDLVSSYPRAAQLLHGLSGLRRIMHLSHRPVANPFAYARQIVAIRRESYDLAVDPSPQSTSGRMTLLFSRSRYRLGFTRRDKGARLTHGCPVPTSTFHESLRPLLLLRAIVADEPELQAPPLHIPLDDAERFEASRRVDAVLAGNNRRGRLVIGYFTDAAGQKALSPRWWNAFWEHFRTLQPDALPIEFMGWQGVGRHDHDHISLAAGDPRQMAAAIAGLDLFITADTGPMHVASATSTPTIGFFTSTDPECYGPRKPNDLALRVLEIDPAQVAQTCVEHFRRHQSGGSGATPHVIVKTAVSESAEMNDVDIGTAAVSSH